MLVRGLGGYRVEGKLIPFACKGPVQMKKKQQNLPRPFQGNGGGDVEWFCSGIRRYGGLEKKKKRGRKKRTVWLLVEFFCLWGNMAGRSCLAAQLLVLLLLLQQRHGRAWQGCSLVRAQFCAKKVIVVESLRLPCEDRAAGVALSERYLPGAVTKVG